MAEVEEVLDFFFNCNGPASILEPLTASMDYFMSNYAVDYLIVTGRLEQMAFTNVQACHDFLLAVLRDLRIICVPAVKNGVIAFIGAVKQKTYENIAYLRYLDAILQANPSLINYVYPLQFLMELLSVQPETCGAVLESVRLLYSATSDSIYLRELLRVFYKSGPTQQQDILYFLLAVLEAGHESYTDIVDHGMLFWLSRAYQACNDVYYDEIGAIYRAILQHSHTLRWNDQSIYELVEVYFAYPEFFECVREYLTALPYITLTLYQVIVYCVCRLQEHPARYNDAGAALDILISRQQDKFEILALVFASVQRVPLKAALTHFVSLCKQDTAQAQRWIRYVINGAFGKLQLLAPILRIADSVFPEDFVQIEYMQLAVEILEYYAGQKDYLEFEALCFATRIIDLVGPNADAVIHHRYIELLLKYADAGTFPSLARATVMHLVYGIRVGISFFQLTVDEKQQFIVSHYRKIVMSARLLDQLCEFSVLTYDDMLILVSYVGSEIIDREFMERRKAISKTVINNLIHYWSASTYVRDDSLVRWKGDEQLLGKLLILILSPFTVPKKVKFELAWQKSTLLNSFNAKYLVIHIVKSLRLIFKVDGQEFQYLFELPVRQFEPDQDIYVYGPNSQVSKIQTPNALLLRLYDFNLKLVFSLHSAANQVFELLCPERMGAGVTIGVKDAKLKIRFFDLYFVILLGNVTNVDLRISVYQYTSETEGVQDILFASLYDKEANKYGHNIKSEVLRLLISLNGKIMVSMPVISPYHCCILMQYYSMRLFKDVLYSTLHITNGGWEAVRLIRGELRTYAIYLLHNESFCVLLNPEQGLLQAVPQQQVHDILCSYGFVRYEDYYDVIVDGNDKIIKCGVALALDARGGGKSGQQNILFKFSVRTEEDRTPYLYYSFKATFCKHLPSSRIQKFAPTYHDCRASFGALTNVPYLSIFMSQLTRSPECWISFNLKYLNAILSVSPHFYDNFLQACEFQNLLHFIEMKHNQHHISYDVIIYILKLAGFLFVYNTDSQTFYLHSVDRQRLYSMDSLWCVLESNLWDSPDLYFVFFMLIQTILSDETYFSFLDRYDLYQLLFNEVILFAPKAHDMCELLKCLKNVSFSFLIYYVGTTNQFFESSSYSQIYRVSAIINYAFGQCYKLFSQRHPRLVFDIFMHLIGNYVFQFDQYFKHVQKSQLGACKQLFFVAYLWTQPFVMLLARELDEEQKDIIVQVIHIIASAQDILRSFDYEAELESKLYSMYFLKLQNEELMRIERELLKYNLDAKYFQYLSANRYLDALNDEFRLSYPGKCRLLMPFAFIKLVELRVDIMTPSQALNAVYTMLAQGSIESHPCNMAVPLLVFRNYVQHFRMAPEDYVFFEQRLQDQPLQLVVGRYHSRIQADPDGLVVRVMESLLQLSKAFKYSATVAELMSYSHSGLFSTRHCWDKMFVLDLMLSIVYSTAVDNTAQLYLSLQIMLHIMYLFEKKDWNLASDGNLPSCMLQSLVHNTSMLGLRYSYLKFADDASKDGVQINIFINIKRITFYFLFQLTVKHYGSLRLNVLQYKELDINCCYPDVKLYINDQQQLNEEFSSFVVCCLVEVFGLLCDANAYMLTDANRCYFGECKCSGKYNERPVEWALSENRFSPDYKYLVQYTLLLFNCLYFKQVFTKQYKICYFYMGVSSLLQYQFKYHEHYDVQQSVQLILYQILFMDQKQLIQNTTFIDLLLRNEAFQFFKTLKLEIRRFYYEATVNINLTDNMDFMLIYDQFVAALINSYASVLQDVAILSMISHGQKNSLLRFHADYQMLHYNETLREIDSSNYHMNAVYQQFSYFGTKHQTNYNLDQIFKSIYAKEIVANMSVDAGMVASSVDIYSQLAAKKPHTLNGAILHQAQVFNGENYQRTIPYFYDCGRSSIDISPLVVGLFQYFERLSIPFFSAMLLDHICNKACKIFIYHYFVYLLIDTPKNQFLSGVVEEFGDAQAVLLQAVQGAMNAQDKLDRRPSKIASFAFNCAQIDRILINKMVSLIERDYSGLNSALDIHTADGKCYGLVFASNSKCKDFVRYIISRQPQMLRIVTSIASNNSRLIQAGDQSKISLMQAYTKTPFNKYLQMLIKAWQAQEISAFQFLTELNVLANRSYSDISQYPIFPLLFGCDATGRTLLTRALQLPVICQSRARLHAYLRKLADAAAFGSGEYYLSSVHYAHCAVSPNYMIRVEPWLSAHLMLYQGKIDQPDRLFRSISIYYTNAMESDQNCEEAVPEAFYDGSVYINSNYIHFGRTYRGELVGNVQLPDLFDTAQQFVYFNAALLEYAALRVGLFEWVYFMFSDKNAAIDGVDLCACLGVDFPGVASELSFYPRITRFCTFKSADIADSLSAYRNANEEPTSASTAMKLVYFGRYPREIFSYPRLLRFSEKECFLQQNSVANDFLEIYMRIYLISIINKQTRAENKQIRVIFQIQTAFLVWHRVPHFNRQIDCLQPGMLFGRRQEFGNIPVRAAAGVNYRDDELQIQYQSPLLKYDALNEQNSLSYANSYFLPRSFKYLQNVTGEYASQYLDGHIIIYSLPFFQLYRVIPIDAAMDVTPTHALNASSASTNEFLICRDYGVLDVLGVDFQSNKIVYMQNIAVCDAELLSVHYNHAWAVAVVVTRANLIVLNMACFYVWFSTPTPDVCENVVIFSESPVFVATFQAYSRVFDIRYAREYTRIAFTQVFCSRESLCGIHNNQIFEIKNFYAQAQKGKLDIEWIGTPASGTVKSVMIGDDACYASIDCAGKFVLCCFEK